MISSIYIHVQCVKYERETSESNGRAMRNDCTSFPSFLQMLIHSCITFYITFAQDFVICVCIFQASCFFLAQNRFYYIRSFFLLGDIYRFISLFLFYLFFKNTSAIARIQHVVHYRSVFAVIE